MSKNYALEADARDTVGKGAARTLRREGKIPAVIYGDKKEPIKITLDSNTINVVYNKGHMFTTLCDLNVGSDKHLVLARDIQTHPVTDVVDHVDFLRVTAKTKIAVDVPVQFINEDKSPGIEEKGVLNVVRHTVELRCSATNIPDYLEVDLTGKKHGDSINISDANLQDGTTPVIDNRDFTIATLLAPKKLEDIEAEEAAEADADAAEDAADGDDAAEESKEDAGE
ncbi:MAG: 50S ribosomal protein L25/general stress protein Ctc [Alphaproteobacteria bacterium]|nr:50S ribosomal protein L25/general stress protein Ctc [Alphaproteobacteria bacterium]